jgi:DegV family protein with EDD domain
MATRRAPPGASFVVPAPDVPYHGPMGRHASTAIPVLSREALRQCVIAGARRVIAHREHLNEINVFPVPDRDTGTNLAATMRAVIAGLGRPLPSLGAVSATLAASALAGAQGNSGVILAQFFQGLREGMGDGVHLTADRFATAMHHAATRARQALAQPREGTILTVMSDVAEHLGSCCRERAHDFRSLVDEGLRVARRSLAETPQRLAALRHAGVVDAGALGFVHFLEGIRDHLFHETTPLEAERPDKASREEKPQALQSDEPLDFRYCAEAVVRGARHRPDLLQTQLSALGDSVVVAGTETLLHAHVHTNVPAVVLEMLADAGALESTKVDDMWTHLVPAPTPAGGDRSGVAVVTDSVCDLPIGFLTARRIQVVPFRVAFGDDTVVDGVDITPRRFYALLRASTSLPTTSQPSPAEFERLYRLLARRFSSIVSVHLSSEISGTLDSARRAAAEISGETGVPIEVADSRTASAGEACVVWAVARAAERGLDASACGRVARAASESCFLFVYVPTVRYFVLGGRLSPLQGRVAQVLGLLPVLTMREGRVAAAGKVLGRRAGIRNVLRRVLRAARSAEAPLFVVSHSEAPRLAAHYERALRRQHPRAEVLIAHAGPALGAHSGPGGAVIAVLDVAVVDRAIDRETKT